MTQTAAPPAVPPAKATPESTVRLVPTDPDAVPALARFLDRLGLGNFVPDTLESVAGRNDNWFGRTRSGREVFVKKIPREPGREHDGFTRSVAFENVRAGTHTDGPATPACLGWDDASGLMAFDLVPGCRSLAELAWNDELDPQLCRQAGQVTARLHGMPTGRARIDAAPAPLPDLDWLTGLPLDMYASCSMAQLQAVQVLQNDDEVRFALHALRESESQAATCPVHADLRLDQFLECDGTVLLSDWEEFRLGDPARDVGTVVGQFLYQISAELLHARHDAPGAAELATDDALTPQDVVDRGLAGLRRTRPLIEEYCAGYRQVRPLPDDVAARAAAFAGWHMFDRLYAAARERSRLSPVQLAAAGIGRTALLRPVAAAHTLGLLPGRTARDESEGTPDGDDRR